MMIDEKNKIAFTIKKLTETRYQLCQVLGEYDNLADCRSGLVSLLDGIDMTKDNVSPNSIVFDKILGISKE